ncbi:site-specific DNA-methyltransferase [[Pseudomonas] carboxydohydrogena]|uniref:site-specific DNA-methyltransferase (adenine-specific) n=1 Tax=Afipia carboxydohydrogena TaxID=290 RepID=A0ABY8BND4_AFICR|nr:site-specific DNA-methyltransferase [[Pseudomonas] carboxydohydrogena]WEF51423.1 site-specific DNA-methyltransferase [[Pseudomonas] carboxydohydrogena]
MTELNFKGKEFVYNHHLAVPFRPLVPHPKKGIGPVAFDSNLIVHGDNLYALKALLPMYAGKVDCVFIDPPYNTGNEGWAYNDNVNAPMIKEWLNANPIGIEDGLRHDKWCAMMWPRLRLLYEMLSDSGSFWITLDDNEVYRAKLMLDEIFGEENFITSLVWEKTTSARNDARFFSIDHDHILVYAKRIDQVMINRVVRTESSDSAYTNPDNDSRGPWREGDYKCAKSADERPNLFYPIKNPITGEEVLPRRERVWAYSKSENDRHVREDRLWWGKTGNYSFPKLKRFRSEAPADLVARTLLQAKEVGQTRTARTEILDIFTDQAFATPKPTKLLSRLLDLATDSSSLVLDSFAGSGTTAHAVLQLNKRDGGNRRFVLVEMEDYADKLTAERVRRVIKGYKFKGTQKTELLRENLNWRTLERSQDLVHRVQGIENLESADFDRITKQIKDGELIVTGEKAVTERAQGLGGEFTYCTLGDPVELDKVLSGESLPPYAAIGAALFHMATNQALDPKAIRQKDFYLGETAGQHVWLIYKPDLDWLKTPNAALTLTRAKAFAEAKPGKRHLVFAPARFVSQKMLTEQNIPVEFVPLPFALYRIERS